MENYEVKYKGSTAIAYKDEKGGYRVLLPNKGEIREAIFREKDGWMFMATEPGTDYCFNVWLKDDGRMFYTNDMIKTVKECTERFSPNSPETDDVTRTCKDMFDVIKQLAEYEKTCQSLGASPTEILDLRKRWLSSSLRILGYSTTDKVKHPLEESSEFFHLGLICDQIRTAGNIGRYMKREAYPNGRESCFVKLPENPEELEELKAMIEQLRENVERNEEIIETQPERDDLFRGIESTYCTNMRASIPPEHWDVYVTAVEQAAKGIMEINYDLVPELDRVGLRDATVLPDYSEEKRVDFQGIISDAIDTTESAVGCSVEDAYVMEQNNFLERKATTWIGDSERVKSSTPGAALEFLKQQAMSTRVTKQKYYDDFAQLDEQYYHTGIWNPNNARPGKKSSIKVPKEENNYPPTGVKLDGTKNDARVGDEYGE